MTPEWKSPKQSLVIGWRAIGQASGRNAATLAHQHSLGVLPITPTRVGTRVAMTPEQIESLRKPENGR